MQKSPGSLSKDEKTAYSTGPHFRNISSSRTRGLYRRLRRLNLIYRCSYCSGAGSAAPRSKKFVWGLRRLRTRAIQSPIRVRHVAVLAVKRAKMIVTREWRRYKRQQRPNVTTTFRRCTQGSVRTSTWHKQNLHMAWHCCVESVADFARR